MKTLMLQSRRGFTIVELLIVIVVIAVLASITAVAYSGIQQRARNSERFSNIAQLQKGLEMYNSDKGFYPNIADLTSQETTCGSQTENWGHCDRLKTLTDALAPYVAVDPTKLSNANPAVGLYAYYYDSRPSDGYKTYALGVIIEGSDDRAANDGGFTSNIYEVGQNPRYCKDTYNGNWRGSPYSQRCPGGP